MNTDDIVQALRLARDYPHSIGIFDRAADVIESLRAQISTQTERADEWRVIAAEWQEQALESQRREQAALEDIKAMQSDLPYGVGCYYCGHYTPAGGDGKCGEGCALSGVARKMLKKE